MNISNSDGLPGCQAQPTFRNQGKTSFYGTEIDSGC